MKKVFGGLFRSPAADGGDDPRPIYVGPEHLSTRRCEGGERRQRLSRPTVGSQKLVPSAWSLENGQSSK
jgi:hypothetical protein